MPNCGCYAHDGAQIRCRTHRARERRTFRALDDTAFAFDPCPFGSVFRLRQPQNAVDGFGVVDVPPPYRALAVALPTNETLVVLFADRGETNRVITGGRGEFSTRLEGLDPRALVFSLLRLQNHLVIPDGSQLLEDRIVSAPIPEKVRLRPQRIERYQEFAGYCGLPPEIAVDAYNLDRVQWAEIHAEPEEKNGSLGRTIRTTDGR